MYDLKENNNSKFVRTAATIFKRSGTDVLKGTPFICDVRNCCINEMMLLPRKCGANSSMSSDNKERPVLLSSKIPLKMCEILLEGCVRLPTDLYTPLEEPIK